MSFFADHSNDTTPKTYSWYGQAGYYALPQGWSVRANANSTLTASPNADFSPPTYDCILNADGTLVVQDLYRDRQKSK